MADKYFDIADCCLTMTKSTFLSKRNLLGKSVPQCSFSLYYHLLSFVSVRVVLLQQNLHLEYDQKVPTNYFHIWTKGLLAFEYSCICYSERGHFKTNCLLTKKNPNCTLDVWLSPEKVREWCSISKKQGLALLLVRFLNMSLHYGQHWSLWNLMPQDKLMNHYRHAYEPLKTHIQLESKLFTLIVGNSHFF